MGSRVRVEQFDDFDQSVRPDVRTYTFTAPDGVKYEIDLHADHFAEMELDFAKYIKVGRKAKRQKGKSKSPVRATITPAGDEPKRQTPQWVSEIGPWAAAHGYDWDDPEQRKAVRQWAFDEGIYSSKSGVIPRRVMEAHHKARQKGRAPWPFA